MLDVGQGDAIAIRTPRGRWLLVDAGPPARGEGAGRPVVQALRARGALRVETLVLTHPDLDHIGGAAAVVEHLRPRTILDPMLPAPKTGYADLVELAVARGVGWSAARAGDVLDVDGVSLRVLHPDTLPSDAEEGNAASVVILLEWRGFEALLTGDAYVDVERAIAGDVGDIDVLKVGHINPDLARYELHRVWVVDATLKPGTGHIYKRRTFYIDEDSWMAAVVDKYDTRDELWRVAEQHSINFYNVPMTYQVLEVHHDLQSGRYIAMGLRNDDPRIYTPITRSNADFTPAGLRGIGTR